MHKRKSTEEIEDALRDLVLMRTRHCSDDPALWLVDEYFAAPGPLDEAMERQQLEALFHRLWRERVPIVVRVFVAGEEREL